MKVKLHCLHITETLFWVNRPIKELVANTLRWNTSVKQLFGYHISYNVIFIKLDDYVTFFQLRTAGCVYWLKQQNLNLIFYIIYN